jgi:hypothetical protein
MSNEEFDTHPCHGGRIPGGPNYQNNHGEGKCEFVWGDIVIVVGVDNV